jgi:hypothetical protein
VLFIADRFDFKQLEAIRHAGGEWTQVPNRPPNYPAKINHAFRKTTEPFLFLAADDVIFHDGWLTAALEKMTRKIAVVGTNDGGVNKRVKRGQHATHMLVRREYVDEFGATFDDLPGVLVHEGYHHTFVDDELVQVAQIRHAYAHAHESLVEHVHPFRGKEVPMDGTYLIGHARMHEDRLLFKNRKLLRRDSWTSRSWSEPMATSPG